MQVNRAVIVSILVSSPDSHELLLAIWHNLIDSHPVAAIWFAVP